MAALKPEDDNIASLISAAFSGKPQPEPQPAPATATAAPTASAAITSYLEPDYAAESFRLPLEAELEWLDRSVAAAAIYERDDSTKGTANPKAQQHGHQHQQQQPQQHGSNRFSGPLRPRKSAILGLPKPVERHSGYIGGPRKAAKNVRIFPKKKGGGGGGGGKGKAGAGVEEPGSPKVSCFGKVRSERERCREQQRKWKEEFQALDAGAPARGTGAGGGGGGAGFWTRLLGPLACCRGNPAVGSVEDDAERRTSSSSSSSASSDRKKKNKKKHRKEGNGNGSGKNNEDPFSNPFSAPAADRGLDDDDESYSAAADPPGLGGLKRFASGRRSSSWGGGEFDASHGKAAVDADASSGPLAPGRRSVS